MSIVLNSIYQVLQYQFANGVFIFINTLPNRRFYYYLVPKNVARDFILIIGSICLMKLLELSLTTNISVSISYTNTNINVIRLMPGLDEPFIFSDSSTLKVST